MGTRTVALVDGFNLYHGICRLGQDHLKWLDLRKLLQQFLGSKDEQLSRVLYFSAYARWLPGPWSRHREYVKALEATGVECTMSQFKVKDRRCRSCGDTWKGHEEKESDVAIGSQLVHLAHKDEFERVLLVSGDSDFIPAVRILTEEFPHKKVRFLTPPKLYYSADMVRVLNREPTKITEFHVSRAMLPGTVLDSTGKVVATRPAEYEPPVR